MRPVMVEKEEEVRKSFSQIQAVVIKIRAAQDIKIHFNSQGTGLPKKTSSFNSLRPMEGDSLIISLDCTLISSGAHYTQNELIWEYFGTKGNLGSPGSGQGAYLSMILQEPIQAL